MVVWITHTAAIWMIATIVAASADNDIPISGDAVKGKRAYAVCKACHQIGVNARNRLGPPLNGVIGRPAGSIKGFRYSKAMSAKTRESLVWDEENLFKYLGNPSIFIGGRSKMTLRLTDEATRRDIIAYLMQIKADGRERQMEQPEEGQ